jgi:hypothetical protein
MEGGWFLPLTGMVLHFGINKIKSFILAYERKVGKEKHIFFFIFFPFTVFASFCFVSRSKDVIAHSLLVVSNPEPLYIRSVCHPQVPPYPERMCISSTSQARIKL